MSAVEPHKPGAAVVLYWRRWWMLFLQAFGNACNAFMWISFAPVQAQSKGFYSTSDFWINVLSIVYMVVSFPLLFVAGWVQDRTKKGLWLTIMIGAILNLVGAWVRYASSFGNIYWVALVGQTIAGSSQPFYLICAPKLAAEWFPVYQRTVATTIASLSNVLGIMLGFLLPPILIESSNPEFQPLLLYSAVASSVASVLTVFTFQGSPPTPASFSQTVEKTSLSVGWRLVFRNRQFVILLVAFGTALGCFNSFLTVLAQVLTPLHYTAIDAGYMGTALMGAGLFGSFIIGAIVDRNHNYKFFIVMSFWWITAGFIVLSVLLRPDFSGELYGILCFIGLPALALLPLCMEASVEVSFPIPEGIPCAVLYLAGQVSGIILTVVMSLLETSVSEQAPFFALSGILVVCSTLVCFFRPVYKRLEGERMQLLASSCQQPSSTDISQRNFPIGISGIMDVDGTGSEGVSSHQRDDDDVSSMPLLASSTPSTNQVL